MEHPRQPGKACREVVRAIHAVCLGAGFGLSGGARDGGQRAVAGDGRWTRDCGGEVSCSRMSFPDKGRRADWAILIEVKGEGGRGVNGES